MLQRIIGWRVKFDLLTGRLRISEIVEFREGFDVGFGKRSEVVLGQRLTVLPDPLRREGRIHFIENPGVPDRLDLTLRIENHLRPRRDPDMRVRRRGAR